MENATDKQIAFLKKKSIDATNMTKQEAHGLISDIVGQPKLGDVTKMPATGLNDFNLETQTFIKPKNSQSSYFVAYAKDLYIAIYDKEPMVDHNLLMQDCINMIKLAKEQL